MVKPQPLARMETSGSPFHSERGAARTHAMFRARLRLLRLVALRELVASTSTAVCFSHSYASVILHTRDEELQLQLRQYLQFMMAAWRVEAENQKAAPRRTKRRQARRAAVGATERRTAGKSFVTTLHEQNSGAQSPIVQV